MTDLLIKFERVNQRGVSKGWNELINFQVRYSGGTPPSQIITQKGGHSTLTDTDTKGGTLHPPRQ